MGKKHGPWTIKNVEKIYSDNFIEVSLNEVISPDNKEGKYSTVKVIPGIAILAIDEDNNVYLTRQFRFALGRDSIEVICGAVEENEEPIKAARRELKEEAGISAKEWKHFGIVNPDTSIVSNKLDLFLARDLSFTEKEQEGSEDIKIDKYSLEHVVDMVISGEITHAPSCVLVLKTNEFLRSSTPKVK
ncbi:MAG: NUDIX hydrolase [Bacillota bacterium]